MWRGSRGLKGSTVSQSQVEEMGELGHSMGLTVLDPMAPLGGGDGG